ncbi:MAG: DUF2283 domain-containing protein [Parcubacteria group bacterium]|nr:DUF2283 domain-containing protein [Parcubacteria group bacterium]
MRFHYDKQVDAVYIRFNKGRYVESDEVKKGIIFDYDRQGKIIGMEFLDASKHLPRELSEKFSKRQLPITLSLKRGFASK